MKKNLTLLGYKITFPGLKKELLDEQQVMFERAILIIRANELQEKKSKMVKMHKPNRNGTSFEFKRLESNGEIVQEVENINSECVCLGLPELLIIKEEMK